MLINAYIGIKGKHRNFVPKNVNSFATNHNFRRNLFSDKVNYSRYLNFEGIKIKNKKSNNIYEHFFCNQLGNNISEKFNYKPSYPHEIKRKEFDNHSIYLNNYTDKENYIQNKYINDIDKYNTAINQVANTFFNSSNRNAFIKTTNRLFQTIIQKAFHTATNKTDDKKSSKNDKKNTKNDKKNKKNETVSKKTEASNKKVETLNKKMEAPNKKSIKNAKNATILEIQENQSLDKKKNIEENISITKEKLSNTIENDTNIKHEMNETNKKSITDHKNKIKNIINNLFEKHLLLMNSLIAGILYFVADIACQFMEMSKQPNEYDIFRTLRMSTIGFTLEGPVMTLWYGKILANFIKSKPNIFLYKSFIPTLFDNFVFGPIHLTIFFFYNGILKKQPHPEIVEKILNTGMNVFFVSFVTWTPLTLVNFFFVPRIYQATVVFFADFFWVIFLSWSANNK